MKFFNIFKSKRTVDQRVAIADLSKTERQDLARSLYTRTDEQGKPEFSKVYLAKKFNVSPSTISKWIREGK